MDVIDIVEKSSNALRLSARLYLADVDMIDTVERLNDAIRLSASFAVSGLSSALSNLMILSLYAPPAMDLPRSLQHTPG